jgi:hypothetical protein
MDDEGLVVWAGAFSDFDLAVAVRLADDFDAFEGHISRCRCVSTGDTRLV